MYRALLIIILFFFTALTQPCFANLSISVNPSDGSNALRFDKTQPVGGLNKQQIHIRINSTNGDRYQVFQRILEPISNEKGDILNLQAIQTETLPNSNSSGTLYLQNSDHMTMGEQLVYSSAQSGSSDSFFVAYSLNQDLIQSGGSFRGRLEYTVRGLGNGSSDLATIDVFLDSAQNLKVIVRGGHEPNKVLIHGADTNEKRADYINISFSGNSGQEIRIYQQIDTVPQNESDQSLKADTLQIQAEGDGEDLRVEGSSALLPQRMLIYSSNKSEDNFNLYFLINPDEVQQQDAGTYMGRIKYIVETAQGMPQEFPLDIQCEIQPVFTLNITAPPGGVSFGHVLANSPAQEKEVLVTVQSNLHKPYQVLQDLQSSMVNASGKDFDNTYFNLQVEIPLGQTGQTDYLEFAPMKTGEYPIYSSDARGSSVTFKAVYRLQGYLAMSPGDFTAPIRFSLNQK